MSKTRSSAISIAVGNGWLMTGVVALALSTAAAPASAGQRALSDFTSQQGAWCAVFTDAGPDCAASYYGGPACASGGFSLSFPQYWSDPKTGITAGIDALGQLDDGSFGTTVDGSVSESPLSGGFADVKVLVHTGNALTRAFGFDADFNTIPLFGYFYGEVLGGAEPTLGDSLLQVTFSNTAPGAPLPDFNQLLICPAPGQALEVFSIRAQASGPLREAFGVPEGTPGRLEVTQTGLIGTSALVNPHSRVAVDAFPAEKVILRATGK